MRMCVCVCTWVGESAGRTHGRVAWRSSPGSISSDRPPSEADCFSKVVNRQASLVRYHSNRGTVKVEK